MALARFGEARRAPEWTEAAVAVAREAVELGLEERGERTPGAATDLLVAGSVTVPDADDHEETEAEAFRAHAETIAEAGVDLLLVERLPSVAVARAATEAGVSTGLPTWSGVDVEGVRHLGEWLEAMEVAEPERLLVYGSDAADMSGSLAQIRRRTSRPVGACLTMPVPREDVADLLKAGADVVGLVDGATAEALQPLREAIDERLRAVEAQVAEGRQVRQDWLARAAAWAPAGAALWLGDDPDLELPAGFDWRVAAPLEAGRLPQDRYRLVVLDEDADGADPERVLRLLESGGILLVPNDAAEQLRDSSRILDRGEEPALAILRRE